MSYAVDVDGNKGKTLNALDNITDTNKQNEIVAAYKELNNLTNEKITFERVREDVLGNTWMCAETLKIKMPVDTDAKENTSETTEIKNGSSADALKTQFDNVNLGLMERPKTKLVLEKHITGLTIKPVESGVRLIADARADINKILNADEGQIELDGEQTGLLAIKSTRSNRGYWYLQTDTTELAQGADAYITYTYVITNKGDEDYLSSDLVDKYKEKSIDEYKSYLEGLEISVKEQIKSKSEEFTKGKYLSNFYYTGNSTGATEVQAAVESMQEFLNPKVTYVDGDNMTMTKNSVTIDKSYYDSNGKLITGIDIGEIGKIKETITSSDSTNKLKIIKANLTTGKLDYNTDNTDWSKKAVVSKALSASEIETGGVYDSYLAEITHYTNAAGRRDQSTPENLSYVHSEDENMNMESYKDSEGNIITAETTITITEDGAEITEGTDYYLYNTNNEMTLLDSSEITIEKNKLIYNETTFEKLNEEDEFWAETFRITKPTGEDKLTPVQIAIITISAVAILGVGIILIKKFVLKK